jgi:hypothetical protein
MVHRPAKWVASTAASADQIEDLVEYYWTTGPIYASTLGERRG